MADNVNTSTARQARADAAVLATYVKDTAAPSISQTSRPRRPSHKHALEPTTQSRPRWRPRALTAAHPT